jgi:aryl-alcohol dehydrogenase-like predicted oxidoreductase
MCWHRGEGCAAELYQRFGRVEERTLQRRIRQLEPVGWVYPIFGFRNTIGLPWFLATESFSAEAACPLRSISAVLCEIRGAVVAHINRRHFLKTGLAAGGLAVTGSFSLGAARQTATDWVTLGKSGVKVTRLAMGTGSFSGQVQRDLGQDGFTRLVRYAYDNGIRFFETAESYSEMHRMLGVALKGIPRDSYRIMSKVTTRAGVNPQEKFDELRKLANTEYFDIMLLHWQHTATWPTDSSRWQDGILEAQSRKAIVSHGASVHGLPALRQVPENRWLDVAMIRMNHKGTRMDAEDYNTDGLGNVPEVVTHVKEARKSGMGVISMKLVGEGTFNREDRQAAMRFAFRNAGVDCVTVGYKNAGEIDEAIENLNLALA